MIFTIMHAIKAKSNPKNSNPVLLIKKINTIERVKHINEMQNKKKIIKTSIFIKNINYYNYDRIKVKLKGLSPVNYRLQSSN